MAGGNNSSPGAYVHEYDMSGRPKPERSTVCVAMGPAKRGPVGQRTLCLGGDDFKMKFGKPDAKLTFAHHCCLSYFNGGVQLYYTRLAPEAQYGGVVCRFDGRFNSLHSWDEGTEYPSEYPFTDEDLFIVYAENPGEWSKDYYVALVPNTKNMAFNTFTLSLYTRGRSIPLRSYEVSLDYQKNGFGVQLRADDHINSRDDDIRVLINENHPLLKKNPAFRYVNTLNIGDGEQAGVRITGGTDGREVTVDDHIMALDLYDDVDEVRFDFFITSGITDVDYLYRLNEVCTDRMDAIVISDIPTDMQRYDKAIAWRRNTLHLDSTYFAMYAPNIEVYDSDNDTYISIPCSGAVAACYANTDRDFKRWFAPAGMIRGSIQCRGLSHVYDQDMRDALYENQINALRLFQSEGVKVWGADTAKVSPSALSNVSVRRLMIYIEVTLNDANNQSVFDPNSSVLWGRLREAAETFLGKLVGEEGLYDFKVVCDETNNTPDTIANGDVMLDIYVDPVIPAKRIFFTAVVNKTGSRVTAYL